MWLRLELEFGGEDTVSETGSETLDLIFDFVERFDGRAVGNVAFGPGRVDPLESAQTFLRIIPCL
jgi:hypothetical protein